MIKGLLTVLVGVVIAVVGWNAPLHAPYSILFVSMGGLITGAGFARIRNLI